MLWPKADFDAAYDKIKQEALSGGCTVLVLLAPTCDSMCAGRILTVSCVTAYFARWVLTLCPVLQYLLRSDNVSYKLKPVSGYDDMHRAYEEEILVAGSEVRTMSSADPRSVACTESLSSCAVQEHRHDQLRRHNRHKSRV
jgi:hypothetical protein